MGILPSCSCVSTTVWLHHLDFSKIPGEKARWELHKDPICCFEQILEAAPPPKRLYSHLPPITQTIQVRRVKYAKSKLISDVLLWTPTPERTSVDWPVKTYIHLLCVDTGCLLEDLPVALTDRDRWFERLKWIYFISTP